MASASDSSALVPFAIMIPSYTRSAVADQAGLKGSPQKAASAAFFSS